MPEQLPLLTTFSPPRQGGRALSAAEPGKGTRPALAVVSPAGGSTDLPAPLPETLPAASTPSSVGPDVADLAKASELPGSPDPAVPLEVVKPAPAVLPAKARTQGRSAAGKGADRAPRVRGTAKAGEAQQGRGQGREQGEARRSGKSPAGNSAAPLRIGEAAALLGLESYVLRFWESEFPEIAPLRTATGQRLYSPEHLEILRRIRHLLHEKGFTIEGARRYLAARGDKPLRLPKNPRPATKSAGQAPDRTLARGAGKTPATGLPGGNVADVAAAATDRPAPVANATVLPEVLLTEAAGSPGSQDEAGAGAGGDAKAARAAVLREVHAELRVLQALLAKGERGQKP